MESTRFGRIRSLLHDLIVGWAGNAVASAVTAASLSPAAERCKQHDA